MKLYTNIKNKRTYENGMIATDTNEAKISNGDD